MSGIVHSPGRLGLPFCFGESPMLLHALIITGLAIGVLALCALFVIFAAVVAVLNVEP